MTETILEEDQPIDLEEQDRLTKAILNEPDDDRARTIIPVKWQGIPPKIVRDGLQFGLIKPLYTVKHYILDAVDIGGYETILDWGVQGCLHGSSLIRTLKGEIELKKIKIGDLIVGMNHLMPTVGIVTQRFINKTDLVRIETDRGNILASSDHKFLTFDGWLPTEKLKRNNRILYLGFTNDIYILDERRDRDSKNIMEKGQNEGRDCFNSKQNPKSGITQKMENTLRQTKTQIQQFKEEDLVKTSNRNRTSILSRNNRRGGNINYYCSMFKVFLPKSQDHNLKYLTGINGLVNKFDFVSNPHRLAEIQRDFNANLDTRQTNSEYFGRDISVPHNKKGTCTNSCRLHKNSGRTVHQRSLLREMSQTFLENKETKLESAKILRISRTHQKTTTYDITTTLGNYIANGFVVHNSGKSTHMLQEGGWIYLKRDRDGYIDRYDYDGWKKVLNNIVMRPQDFVKKMKSIEFGERVPWLGWDDIGVHFPSAKFKTDIKQYEAIDACWAAIRTKCTVISLSIPLIDRLAKNIKDNITIEVFVGRNQWTEAQRILRMIGYGKLESAFFKACIETPHPFNLKYVPKDVFTEYWDDMRLPLADETIDNLDQQLSPENLTPITVVSKMTGLSILQIQRSHKRGGIRGIKVNGQLNYTEEQINLFNEQYSRKKMSASS